MKMKYKVNPVKEFPKVEKILYSLAHRFSETYRVSFDECKSEAYYAFMRACMDYNPDRGQKFSSWVYYWAWCKLKDMIIARSKEPLDFIEINEDLLGAAPSERAESLELIEDLSDDAKEIIALLMETPKEILVQVVVKKRKGGTYRRRIKPGHAEWKTVNPKQLLARVKAQMIAKGHKRSSVEKAHLEIQSRMQLAWAGSLD